MNKTKLSSKAKTLELLSKVIKSAKVLPMFRFNVLSHENRQSKILNNIKE